MPQVEVFHTSVVWDVDWDVNVQNIFLHKKIIEFLGIWIGEQESEWGGEEEAIRGLSFHFLHGVFYKEKINNMMM